ncbi:fumarylacetoacetate hydrolase family protein [Mesorhizobium sp. M0195]|uniref:2-keto-4-pentenoate hydratase n=1 Tax=unclassified Mesorhizobium TaxID=325217 RepID=UPI00333AF02E
MSKGLHAAALRLVEKRKNTCCGEVRLTGIETVSEAYMIQEQTRLIMDASLIGWKASLQADGKLLSAPVLQCDTFNTGSTVPLPGRADHGLECELAFLIDTSLPPRPSHGYTRSDVAPHVSGVMPAFEMLSSRLADAFRSPQAHLVADNLGNGGVVLGVPSYAWHDRSLAAIGITLSLDGQVILSKHCTHPAGDPFDVLVALANHLSERKLELRAGQFVIAGSYTPAQKVRRGSKIVASFDGFQSITLSIAAEDELLASAPASGWNLTLGARA